ncbi:tripartite tricarboxylate transporter substrate binding protein [Siccirubricoccus sp. KC 17139]|uniref:Tripartite tricarboxylate transporter substrate binding protein n=1 Tax=Siccirubricoccus soli TaxID=2899147 RepID=A0ABT1CZJ3_9PROT|nr:tripartite tricarboxylate transporter substrate binding protein [Siccirubricoccus soli]MCO6415071.1 tripartite tricarboxylate transporter substrate binding protein [Siccirubricoccus soli]MCP2681202.1 tripartite tricarboxylate transporter substrate binding protein [Siccirubricoccus soli]
MGSITRRRLGALGAGFGLATAGPAAAQAWPSRAVALVVPFVPGGSADVIGRPLAQHLSTTFGQSFVVDNRGGANGNVGTHAVTRAEPDGQVLLVTTNGPISTNTLLFRRMPYNPLTNLTPIALLSDLPVILVARRDAPYASLRDMLAYAKANPGKINCGVPATGALGHLAAELLRRRAGIDLTIVPFRGGATAATGLLSGTVEMAIDLVPAYQTHIQAGTVRALGVAATEPLAALPGAEPIASQGLPGFEAIGWTAILGPPGLPAGIVQKVNEAANRFLQKPETRTMLDAVGSRLLGGTPEALARRMQAEVAIWRPVIADARITLE